MDAIYRMIYYTEPYIYGPKKYKINIKLIYPFDDITEFSISTSKSWEYIIVESIN